MNAVTGSSPAQLPLVIGRRNTGDSRTESSLWVDEQGVKDLLSGFYFGCVRTHTVIAFPDILKVDFLRGQNKPFLNCARKCQKKLQKPVNMVF